MLLPLPVRMSRKHSAAARSWAGCRMLCTYNQWHATSITAVAGGLALPPYCCARNQSWRVTRSVARVIGMNTARLFMRC